MLLVLYLYLVELMRIRYPLLCWCRGLPKKGKPILDGLFQRTNMLSEVKEAALTAIQENIPALGSILTSKPNLGCGLLLVKVEMKQCNGQYYFSSWKLWRGFILRKLTLYILAPCRLVNTRATDSINCRCCVYNKNCETWKSTVREGESKIQGTSSSFRLLKTSTKKSTKDHT